MRMIQEKYIRERFSLYALVNFLNYEFRVGDMRGSNVSRS